MTPIIINDRYPWDFRASLPFEPLLLSQLFHFIFSPPNSSSRFPQYSSPLRKPISHSAEKLNLETLPLSFTLSLYFPIISSMRTQQTHSWLRNTTLRKNHCLSKSCSKSTNWSIPIRNDRYPKTVFSLILQYKPEGHLGDRSKRVLASRLTAVSTISNFVWNLQTSD